MKKILIITALLTLFSVMGLFAATLISPTGDGGFETGATFEDNGWTVVNGTATATQNQWYLGTSATAGIGSGNVAYITNNTATGAYSYSNAGPMYVVHFYRDVIFPAGETVASLTFNWKGVGESTAYDGLQVSIAPTTVTPTAIATSQSGSVSTTIVAGATFIGNVLYFNQSTQATASINIPSALLGNTTEAVTRRLIFTFRLDGSLGTSPATSIDNIALETRAPNPLGGTYSINPANPTTSPMVHNGTGNFNSFTAAVSHINADGISSSVTFNVSAGSVFAEEVPFITATGTAANPIIFQKSGAGANPEIQPTTGNQGIRIVGGDYITFDGIDIRVATGQIPNWGYYITNASATNGALYNTIKNCKITLNKANTSTKGIYDYFSVTPSAQGGINSYNTYQNITIENSNQGIYVYGTSTYYVIGSTIRDCTIGGATADDMGGGAAGYGIYTYYTDGINIYNNSIRNFTCTSSTVYGMYMYYPKSTTNVYNNNVYNLKTGGQYAYTYGIYPLTASGTVNIYNNKVYNLETTFSTSTYQQYGLYVTLSSTGSNTANIYNNMVWDIKSAYTGSGSTSYLATGIYLDGATATNTYNVDYNSVRIVGPATSNSVGVYFAANTAVNKLRNNVIVNNTPNQTGSYYHPCVYYNHATTIGAATSVANNNVLYFANANNGLAVRGSTTNYASIQAWNSASTHDGASRPTDPQIDAANPLNILTGVPTPVESKGMVLDITTDIYGTTRNASTPDIGAHEGNFTLESFCETPTAQPTGLVLIPSSTTISGSFTAATANAYLVVGHQTPTLTFSPVDGTYYTAGQVFNTTEIVVSASSATSFTATGLTANTQYYTTIFAFNNTGLGAPKYYRVSPLTGTMTTLPAAPAVPASFTATSAGVTQINLAATANASTNDIVVAWNSTNTFGTPLENASYTVGSSLTGGGTILYMGPASGLTNHTGLSESTAYYYAAWSYLTSGAYQVFSTTKLSANATTAISPVSTLPYFDGFETGNTHNSTSIFKWTQAVESGSYYWTANSSLTDYNRTPRTGSFNAFVHYSCNTWMFRGVNLTGGTSYDVEVWARQDMADLSYASVGIHYGTAAAFASMTTPIVAQTGITNGDYQRIRGSFTPATTGTYYIGIHGIMNSTPWYISIDDFSISETPPTPTFSYTPATYNLGSTQIGTPTAYSNITVTNSGGGVLTLRADDISLMGADTAHFNFDAVNLPADLNPAQSVTIPVRFNPSTIGAKTATLRMVYDTVNYDVALSGVAHLSTDFLESFESATFPPAGWTNPGSFSRSTTTPYHLTASAYKYSSTTASILATPLLDVVASSRLSFWARTSTANNDQRIQIVSSPDKTVWTAIGAEISLPSAGTWTPCTVDLSSLAGTSTYFGFQVRTVSAAGGVFIDRVIGPSYTPLVPDAPTLSTPADLATAQPIRPTLTWTAASTGGIPTGFKVYCDTNANPTTLITTVTASPYTFTAALAYSTTYYWKIVATNLTGDTSSTIRSFTTIADPTIYTLPYTTDFTGTFPPAGWNRFGGVLANPTVPSGTGSWIQDDWRNITTPVNQAARINIYSTLNGWLITPPISIPGNNYEVKFDLALTAYGASTAAGTTGTDDIFAVLIGDGNTWTPANVVRQWDNAGSQYVLNEIPNTGINVTLPIGSAGTKYIAFYGISTTSNADNDLFVDNVMVRQIPSGPPEAVTLVAPANNAQNIALTGFNLSWTPSATGGNPDEYNLFMSQNLATLYSDVSFGSLTATTFNPVTDGMMTFAYGQTWYWTVQAVNGEGDVLPESPFSFTIMSDPRILSLPYTQNFDAVTAPALPNSFTKLGTGTVQTQASSANSSPNCMYMYSSATTTISMLAFPEMVLTNANAKLSFMGRANYTAGGIVQVGYLTTPNDPATFVSLGQVAMASLTYASYSVELGDINGSMFLAMRVNPVSPFNSVLLDNIEITQNLANDMSANILTIPGMGMAGTVLDASVTVQNKGTMAQNSYMVKLYSVDTRVELASVTVNAEILPNATAMHTISWTPATSGAYNVYAKVVLTGDLYAGNDNTATKSITVYPVGTYMPLVGNTSSTTTTNTTPLNVYYKNSLNEVVYLGSELMMSSGTINAIIYHNNFTQDLNKPIKIWMKNTTAENVATGFLPWADYVLVYDGIVNFPIGVNAVVISLQTPFAYTGGNLAVRTLKAFEANWDASTNVFYYTANTNYPSRMRYHQVDGDGAFDYLNYLPYGSSTPFTGTISNNIPNTMFVVSPAVQMETVDAPVVSIRKEGTNVVLGWMPVANAYSYKIFACDDPYTGWDFDAPLATVYKGGTSMIESNPIPGVAKKFFKVLAYTYRGEELNLEEMLNPAKAIGFDNSKVVTPVETQIKPMQ